MGFGKIDILMHDVGIEDISCDGIGVPIFIFHKDFESIRTNLIFKDLDELDSFVVKLSQMCGKQISVYEPIVDGKLSDGSRLQTTLSRTITRYSTFTIRRFKEEPLTPIDLIENNTMSIDMAAYFWMAIEKGTSILFCGGTATGKTTALNALSLFLPSTFKIVSIEDTREINLPHENWIAGTTRTGFTSSEITKTGKDIDMFDLIKVALRQRPKVIIVGEVRGKEAYTLFQAMTTGHLSYSTVHASDMHSLIQRLENKPIDLPRALLTSLDLIVFLNSVTVDGNPVRRITNVTEVIKLDPGANRLVTLTPFSWISEIDDTFVNTGGSRILQKIKMQYGWDDLRLIQELENRKKVLKWMMKNNLRTYEDVGRIVAQYGKDPQSLLKKVKENKK
jgi:flagellar protein FlaI